MAEPEDVMRSVIPRNVLQEISNAIPEACKKNVTIIGSLAVGYCFEDQIVGIAIRTKDADCLLSPRVEAVNAGRAITEELIESGWHLKEDGEWGKPGNDTTPLGDLPVVRIFPPKSSEWFIELLAVPTSPAEFEKKWVRLETSRGHFGLPSFGYLSIAGYDPMITDMCIAIARPEMMALANMLEHPMIRPDLMSGLITGRKIKRSNKDLGRVLAISLLATKRNKDTLLGWPELWMTSLQAIFPDNWKEKARQVGSGIRQLLNELYEPDLDEALHTCENGLLASIPPTMEQLHIAGERLLVDAIEPLEKVVECPPS
jgi:hypothetical protein